ncbi:MAG: hypothetical protein AB7P40_30800 [Chloroflexota bacterium]
MVWLIGSIGYLLAHALLFFAVLRTLAAFSSERGVFLYHFVSGVLFTLAAGVSLLIAPSSWVTPAFAIGTVMLHGVYSLSFLEVWSLTEGGYSLQIMRAIGASQASGQRISHTELERIGRGKQSSRTGSLEAFGWITRAHGTLRLTPRGRIVATLLYGLHSLVSVRQGQ